MEDFILKDFAAEVKAVEGERALNVTITTNTVDRSGDIVEPKGGKLTNFRKNPVVLMAHDYQGLPIGKASNLEKTENGINAKVTFPEEGVYPLADTVYNMYKQKYMRAWSIGFIPIKSEDIVPDDEKDKKGLLHFGGRRFKIWELLEFSACAVPNNPDVSTNMVKKGIDVEPLKEAGFITIIEDKENKLADSDESNKIAEDIRKKVLDTPVVVKNIDVEKVKASIEKDEKEEGFQKVGLLDVFGIYDIIKENKELKEKLEDIELKAGAVLNAKNKSNLKNAQALIQSVLDSAGEEEGLEEGEKKTKDTKKDDTVIIITDTKRENPPKDEKKEEKTITVDEKIIAEQVTKVLKYTLGITDK